MSRNQVKMILIFLLLFLAIENILCNSSPVQPDFSKFESVNTNKLVNEFDGSFTYNLPILTVPGPNGSGYTLSLSYHSGLCPEGDASWVGYGWTLNPGSIIRNVNGFPDDNYDTKVKYWNKVEPVTTTTIGFKGSTEIWSNDIKATVGLGLTYNSDFGYSFNVGCDLLTPILNTKLNLNSRGTISGSFGLDPSPLISMTSYYHDAYNFINDHFGIIKSEIASNKILSNIVSNGLNEIGSKFGTYREVPRVSAYKSNYKNSTCNGTLELTSTVFPGFGASLPLEFRHNSVESDPFSEEKSTFGYMYSNKNNTDLDLMDLQDYSIEKDYEYNNRSIYLGIPFGNPDYFTVTGEGIGGSFKSFMKSANYYRPPIVNSIGLNSNLGLSIDLGGHI